MTIRRVAYRGIFYLTTIILLGLLGWTIRYTQLYSLSHVFRWVLIYCATIIYIIGAIIFIARRVVVFERVVAHSILLQIVPLIASILILCLVPRVDSYKPLPGTPSSYERVFNDLQPIQKRAALANGLAPFKSRADVEEQYKQLQWQNKLAEISSNRGYVVNNLTHSSPYVVPKVKELLDDIATSFQEKTQSKSKFVVTSVLRTEEDARRLNKSNINASLASCHCNATTIDISYVRFSPDKVKPRSNYELRKALAKTLHELRKAGRCYVKIERKQYCYHITVR